MLQASASRSRFRPMAPWCTTCARTWTRAGPLKTAWTGSRGARELSIHRSLLPQSSANLDGECFCRLDQSHIMLVFTLAAAPACFSAQAAPKWLLTHRGRRERRAGSWEQLQLGGDALEYELEEFDCNEDGLVIFDGGTYSRGPSMIGARSHWGRHRHMTTWVTVEVVLQSSPSHTISRQMQHSLALEVWDARWRFVTSACGPPLDARL
jgi:hypothetical protein